MRSSLSLCLIVGLISILGTTSCEQAKEGTTASYQEPEAYLGIASAPGGAAQAANTAERKASAKPSSSSKRKLIKKGDVTFQTDDLKKTRKSIMAAIEVTDGYLAEDREDNYGQSNNYFLTVRVPAQNFDTLLALVGEGVSHFDSKTINVSDVTEEFLDIQARLKTKKELEERYRALLKQANQVAEILEIEREIGNLRSEIESVEGRLNYLKNQVGFSTLSIHYYQESTHKKTHFGEKFSNGFYNGWQNLLWFFVGLVNIWPFLLIIAVLITAFYRWLKKFNKKEDQGPQS